MISACLHLSFSQSRLTSISQRAWPLRSSRSSTCNCSAFSLHCGSLRLRRTTTTADCWFGEDLSFTAGSRTQLRNFTTSELASMLQESEAPSFKKTITKPMLKKNNRLVIPRDFDNTHGDLLGTVIYLRGPSGETRSVEVTTYALPLKTACKDAGRPPGRPSGFRRYLSDGWVGFAKENGFKTRDEVIFKLVGISRFHVNLVSKQLQEKPSKCDKRSRLSDNSGTREEDGTNLPPSKVTRLHDPKPRLCPARENVAVVKHGHLQEAEYFKHPGLVAAISASSKFPRFVCKLTKVSLFGRDVRLGLPYRFATEHGHKFQERVVLYGPNGGWGLVKLRILSTIGTKRPRVQFRYGWEEFALENRFKKGDVLLFSLVELSQFVVKVFPEAKSLQ